MLSVPIISVTGTKGKTTTVAVIADVLRTLEHNVLKVDTTGHFVNGERRSTLEDSKDSWWLVPSVAPGRYLWEFYANPELRQNGVAVLECSLGSSASSGLAYRYHSVGVFLNVFEDHLGSSDRLQTKADIAEAKQFIFSRLYHKGGYAVFNADDELVVGRLIKLPQGNTAKLLPFGLDFSHFDLDGHLNGGGAAVTLRDRTIVLKTKAGETVLADLTRIPWVFDGHFMPSVWNLMAAAAAIYGLYDGRLPDGFQEALEAVRLDPYGGRLTLLKNENNVTVLADYAHEKISLETIASLARSQTRDGGRVIGVVRLAHDRTDELIRDTGKVIGAAYDEVVVYDKIDGHFRHARGARRFPQVVGRTSEILTAGVRETNEHVTRILREDEAATYAASIAEPGDVVVYIVNDDIERSVGFIKQAFKADFV